MAKPPVLILLAALLGCSPSQTPSVPEPWCPDVSGMEKDAASTLGLEPPVNISDAGCVASLVGFGDGTVRAQCGLLFEDALRTTSRQKFTISARSMSVTGLRFDLKSSHPNTTATHEEQAIAAQVLIGAWLMRTFTIDELADLAVSEQTCVEANSPAANAMFLLRHLSEENGVIIEILVCGT